MQYPVCVCAVVALRGEFKPIVVELGREYDGI